MIALDQVRISERLVSSSATAGDYFLGRYIFLLSQNPLKIYTKLFNGLDWTLIVSQPLRQVPVVLCLF